MIKAKKMTFEDAVEKYQINKHFVPQKKDLIGEKIPYQKSIKIIQKLKKYATPIGKLLKIINLKEDMSHSE